MEVYIPFFPGLGHVPAGFYGLTRGFNGLTQGILEIYTTGPATSETDESQKRPGPSYAYNTQAKK
jgi:hypothetical protein